MPVLDRFGEDAKFAIIEAAYKMRTENTLEQHVLNRMMSDEMWHITNAFINLEKITYLGESGFFGARFQGEPRYYGVVSDSVGPARDAREYRIRNFGNLGPHVEDFNISRLVDGALQHIGLAIIYGLDIYLQDELVPLEEVHFDAPPHMYRVYTKNATPDDHDIASNDLFYLPPEVLT